MNKSELVNAISANSGLSKEDSRKALNGFLQAVSEALKNDDKVALSGFGSFEAVQRQARTGINPSTKERIEIPAKKVVKFKAGADLVDLVNP